VIWAADHFTRKTRTHVHGRLLLKVELRASQSSRKGSTLVTKISRDRNKAVTFLR